MPNLVLIDGNAIIHRAYHSMPKSLSTRSGEPTNAVYGFTVTLIKVLEDLKPDYIAATFDLAGPTFRHEVYEDYKATRVKADQELYDQIPRVKQLVETMGIPIYEKEGFEADDVIGTIIKKLSAISSQLSGNSETNNSKKLKAKSQQLIAFIVSGDKDIFQLVNGNVKVYNLKKGLSQTQIVDAEVIEREYNLQPSDFIDLKALAGDPSDNIPGVPGIGPKTATELIQRFDTLEKLYDCLDQKSKIKNQNENIKCKISDIKPRVLDLLIKYREQAFLSQHLATIHKDVPIEFDLEKCLWGEYDRDKLRQLFEELGFQSLLRRFKGNQEIEKAGNQIQKSEVEKNDEQLRLL